MLRVVPSILAVTPLEVAGVVCATFLLIVFILQSLRKKTDNIPRTATLVTSAAAEMVSRIRVAEGAHARVGGGLEVMDWKRKGAELEAACFFVQILAKKKNDAAYKGALTERVCTILDKENIEKACNFAAERIAEYDGLPESALYPRFGHHFTSALGEIEFEGIFIPFEHREYFAPAARQKLSAELGQGFGEALVRAAN